MEDLIARVPNLTEPRSLVSLPSAGPRAINSFSRPSNPVSLNLDIHIVCNVEAETESGAPIRVEISKNGLLLYYAYTFISDFWHLDKFA